MYIELKLTIEKGELTDESFHQIISLLEEPCGFYVDDVGARLYYDIGKKVFYSSYTNPRGEKEKARRHKDTLCL